MSQSSRFNLVFKAMTQLGPGHLALYGLYQLGLRSGYYRRALSTRLARLDDLSKGKQFSIHPCLPALPESSTLLNVIGDQVSHLYRQADEIVDGHVRLFGGQPIPLELSLPGKHEYWTKYATSSDMIHGQDIKFTWEPGRFGWACVLAMAYYLSQDERYADSFWLYTGRFLTSNLPYDGPHWSSAQEVAIRLISIAFAIQIFAQSKEATSERLTSLAKSLAIHAERIPPTLTYARSQNNNHLILEALGLYTASAALPEHPLAPTWHQQGWRWLMHAFRTQISSDGTYIQHSTNYHRLMLQAALWAVAVHNTSYSQEEIPLDITSLLEASTQWLWKLVDPESGQVPNLGHNDGAYILPLSICPFYDYRPIIYAAAGTFLHTHLTPNGAWSDMSLWLCTSREQNQPEIGLDFWHHTPPPAGLNTRPPYILHNPHNGSWGTLYVSTYHSRPAHADQLHLDLWWRGLNIAQDAGTFLYSSPPPWENSLASAFVHNTVVIDGHEFMQRYSKFLFLDWAQGKVLEYSYGNTDHHSKLIAEHNGYRKIRVKHTRNVMVQNDGYWEIIDQVDGLPGQAHTVRLHWLMPDWEYEVLGPTVDQGVYSYIVRIHSPADWITLKIAVLSLQQAPPPRQISFQLVRAGTVLFGSGKVAPIAGWTSLTYGDKIPALASIFEVTHILPITLRSEWILPVES